MIEVICNDRLGRKIRVKANSDDTIGDLKKILAAQTGTRPEKIRLQKWHTVFKDHITLEDYEVGDNFGFEMCVSCAARRAPRADRSALSERVVCVCVCVSVGFTSRRKQVLQLAWHCR